MAKRRKPLRCKICGKGFSFSAKTHPLSRLNKHRWKDHKTQATKAIKKRPARGKVVSELELADDLLLKQINQLKATYSPQQPYQAEHNIAIGALIQGVMLGVEIAQTVAKGVKAIKKAKKK